MGYLCRMPASGNRIHRLGALLLLSLMAIGGSSRLEILAYYRLNHAYIAAHLCVNRDRPAMHCNGKCFLHRELQRDAQQQRNPNEAPGFHLELSAFLMDDTPGLPAPPSGPRLNFPHLSPGTYEAPLAPCFHPPAC